MILSMFLENLEYLHPEVEGLPVHGANLSTAALLRRCAHDPELEAMEIFLPPQIMARPAALAEAARTLLGSTRAGQGFLRFYPVHGLPEVWADPRPRILLCHDPVDMPRIRYLRDRFATGPMAICCDTHAGESQYLIGPLTRLAAAEPVPYDAVVCLSAPFQVFMRTLMDDLAPAATVRPFRLELIPRESTPSASVRLTPTDANGRDSCLASPNKAASQSSSGG